MTIGFKARLQPRASAKNRSAGRVGKGENRPGPPGAPGHLWTSATGVAGRDGAGRSICPMQPNLINELGPGTAVSDPPSIANTTGQVDAEQQLDLGPIHSVKVGARLFPSIRAGTNLFKRRPCRMGGSIGKRTCRRPIYPAGLSRISFKIPGMLTNLPKGNTRR